MAYSNYIHRTPSGAGNRKTFTISTWVKRPTHNGQGWIMTVDSYPSGNMVQFQLDTGSYLGAQQYHGSSTQASVTTNNYLRDPAAWYHLVLRVDTTQSTAADRVRIYINGTEASYNVTTYPSQNFNFEVNDTKKHSIGSREDSSSGASLYYSHYHFCDGYSYGPDSFGSTDATIGQWKINTSPSVSYGTNGFFILKDGNSVTDQSGQSNNFTVSGTLTKTEDCPSNVFCTMNPLDNNIASSTFSNGNNTIVTNQSNYTWNTGTLGMTSGKFYWEVKYGATSNNSMNYNLIGIADRPTTSNTAFLGSSSSTANYAYYSDNGHKYFKGSSASYGASYSAGDIIGVAVDLDNAKLYFSKNGTWQNSGVPTSGSTGTGAISIDAVSSTTNGVYFPASGDYGSTQYVTNYHNFGNGYFGTTAVSSAGTNASNNGIFEYDVPNGYTALSTKGLNL